MGFNPTITLIVVNKCRHVRFFPRFDNEGDRSGNCIAGTVVDSNIVNPVEFDFYLQSHGGLAGTSRPAHYTVLIDDNQFTYVVAFLSDSFAAMLLSMLTIHTGLTVYSH
jgi:eukaryotic translation initiation factor 2C